MTAAGSGVGFPERQAEAGLARIGLQHSAIWVERAIEEHPLDPLEVVASVPSASGVLVGIT